MKNAMRFVLASGPNMRVDNIKIIKEMNEDTVCKLWYTVKARYPLYLKKLIDNCNLTEIEKMLLKEYC